jgi:hypothetical protein
MIDLNTVRTRYGRYLNIVRTRCWRHLTLRDGQGVSFSNILSILFFCVELDSSNLLLVIASFVINEKLVPIACRLNIAINNSNPAAHLIIRQFPPCVVRARSATSRFS